MAQSDQFIQNATFPAVRADINDNLAALYSQSSGNSAPVTTVAFQPWIDTSSSPAVWKVRNATNTGWVTVGTIDAAFSVSGVTAIANGGTGQTTASGAINALAPSQAGNSGKFLTTNGTAVSWAAAATESKTVPFFSSGSWTCPEGVTFVTVVVVGGGGGGGGNINPIGSGAGGPGGYGGVGIGCIAVTAGTVYSITIGAGGDGNNGAAGNAGGDSSFSTTITATGGAGGGAGSASTPGSRGASGSCSDAAADIRRSIDVASAVIPHCPISASDRGAGSGITGVAYSVTFSFKPGSPGAGETNGGSNNAAGGVGGFVLISY